jgi:bifunctional DNA-binding transcriptional regulator/antitoxin component of YhaV-PrlF toxin-antitoxin module
MKKYKFKAKIEAGDGGGAYVLFPYDTEKEFATKGKVPVKATFNGVPYMGSLMKYGKPLHVMGMPKSIREQIGKSPGDTIEVVVWRDEEVRTVKVPAQFEKLIKKKRAASSFRKTKLHPPQGVLPLDYRRQERRNTIEAIGESH